MAGDALIRPRNIRADPWQFFLPPYVGPKGWVGVRLIGGSTRSDGLPYLEHQAPTWLLPVRLIGAVR